MEIRLVLDNKGFDWTEVDGSKEEVIEYLRDLADRIEAGDFDLDFTEENE